MNHYNIKAVSEISSPDGSFRGVAQMVARLVRDQEARGSNPRTPTMKADPSFDGSAFILCRDLNHHHSRRVRLHRPVRRLGDSYIPVHPSTGMHANPRTPTNVGDHSARQENGDRFGSRRFPVCAPCLLLFESKPLRWASIRFFMSRYVVNSHIRKKDQFHLTLCVFCDRPRVILCTYSGETNSSRNISDFKEEFSFKKEIEKEIKKCFRHS